MEIEDQKDATLWLTVAYGDNRCMIMMAKFLEIDSTRAFLAVGRGLGGLAEESWGWVGALLGCGSGVVEQWNIWMEHLGVGGLCDADCCNAAVDDGTEVDYRVMRRILLFGSNSSKKLEAADEQEDISL